MKLLKILLIFVPISVLGHFMHWNETVQFILAALAIIPLAGMMGEATEEIAIYTGPKIGGLLNSTFGNATELIISFFALKAGLFDVVKASIVGSVVGNILLVLGASMLAGGIKYKTQYFNKRVVDTSSSMLFLAVIGLVIPAVFMHTIPKEFVNTTYEGISVFVAVVMFVIYILNLVFTFVTHKDVYKSERDETETETEQAKWTLKKAIIMLVIATIVIAVESEFLVSAVNPMTESLGLSKFFVGIIIIPIIGNAAEHSTAIIMAIRNKMDIAVEIAVGSSLQIILFVTPVLIFLSLIFTPMSLIFNIFELAALIASILIASKVTSDGESNWFEGVQLLSVYLILAAAFFII